MATRTSSRSVFCATVFSVVLIGVVPSYAQIPYERERMKEILDVVSKTIASNYYDPSLKALNWKQLTEETRQRIDKAENANGMLTAIFALVQTLQDSHTLFLPPGRVRRHVFGFEAKAYGNEIRIYEVKKNGAASAAGLKPGDRILAVNGFAAAREDFDLMMLYFRVLQPTPVLEITYQRPNEPIAKISLQAKTTEKTVITDLTDVSNIWDLIREAESEEKPHHWAREGDIGYLHVADFEGEDLSGLLGKVKDTRATIVDLRGNPGGRLDTLRAFAGSFTTAPVVMAEAIDRKKKESITVRPRKPNLSGPLVVLVDSQTASAAEMFARHVQLAHLGIVVGDHTSGRVTASKFFSEQNGLDTVVFYGVQVAVARLVFPDGGELERKGVTPDQMCIPTAADLASDRDVCRRSATEYLIAKLAGAGQP